MTGRKTRPRRNDGPAAARRPTGPLPALALALVLGLPRALFAAGVEPAATLAIGPVPAWVTEAADADLAAPAAAAKDAQGWLLVDRQVNVATGERYYRYVSELRTSEAVQEGSTVTVDYDPAFERLVFHRIEVTRDGNRSSRLSRGAIELLRREPSLEWQMIDGSLTATVVLRDIRPGDRLDVAYTVRGFNPVLGGRYVDEFFGGWTHPVGTARVRILAPEDRPLRFGLLGGAAPLEQSSRGSAVEYLWQMTDTPSIPDEDLTPSWHVTAPWLLATEFGDWEEVRRWALSLFPAARLPAELAALADGWRERTASSEERALAAVDWVQRNIRYVGIELGAGSYRPSPPATVASRRFGDCKDQVHLLCALLARMGIEASPVLVSTWAGPLVTRLPPSPLPFDHVVARVVLGDRAVLVDPTWSSQRGPLADRYVPDWGHGLLVAEGARGLLAMSPHQGVAPDVEIVERLRTGRPGKPAELVVETTARGGAADDTRWQFANSRLEEIATSYLNYYASRYPAIESAGELAYADDEAANVFRITERYRLPEFWIEEDGDVWGELLADAIIDELPRSETRIRTTPLWVDHPRRVVQRMEVELPAEWDDWTDRATFTNAAFELKVDQRVSGRSAMLVYDYRSLAAEVAVADVPGVQESVRDLDPYLGFELTWDEADGAGGPSRVVLAVGLGALAAAAAAAVFVYRRAARPAEGAVDAEIVAPAAASPEASPPRADLPATAAATTGLDGGGPRGIGGWLVLVAIGLVARPVVSVVSLVRMAPALSAEAWAGLTAPGGSAFHPLWAPLLLFEVAANVALAVADVLLAVLFFQRRRAFPRGFIALLVAQVVVALVDLAGTAAVPGDGAGSSAAQVRLVVSTLVASAVWIAYLLRSRRVKLTFVR